MGIDRMVFTSAPADLQHRKQNNPAVKPDFLHKEKCCGKNYGMQKNGDFVRSCR